MHMTDAQHYQTMKQKDGGGVLWLVAAQTQVLC
jgi:hypothetical protein